jgi:two-component system, LuxR family, response regulator FixJ
MTDEPLVYVVDDDPGALRSLCWLLEQADLPARAFASGQEFLDQYQGQQPGCLVLDVRMPEVGGLEVQQRLLASGRVLPIIFITAHGDVPSCVQALKAGAADFLEKPLDGKVFLERVHTALAQAQAEVRRQREAAEVAQRMERLTRREKDVLGMLICGKSLKEIAAAHDVSVQTIWKQRSAIFHKMRVENEIELARLAASEPSSWK